MHTTLAVLAAAGSGVQTSCAFVTPFVGKPFVSSAVERSTVGTPSMVAPRVDIPLELEGKLDSAREWEIEMELDGEVQVLTVKEGTSVLNAAKSVYDSPPHSCQQGICTTCAGFIREGKEGESYRVAVDALSNEQKSEGFTLTCQTYPCGPGLKVLLNQYDKVYERQYGQYEISEQKKQKKGFMGMF